jgi:hypothetical protein
VRSLVAAFALGFALVSHAQESDLWEWRGETNLKLENYSSRGDLSATPYPYSGNQETLGVSFDAERRANPFDFTRFQFTGTQSHSLYYAPDYGFYPERFNITQQSGTAALPYQGQLGDYFGTFSYRTLQTSLRGGLVELQPQDGSADRRHSMQLLSGAASQNYRDFQWKDNRFNGASYLYEQRGLGRFALNWVNNLKQADLSVPTLERTQDVWSGAAEIPFSAGLQNLRFETEWAGFSGDTDSAQDRKDSGFFGELGARGTKALAPLDWRVRYERYGKDYRPAGAVVSPDQISQEGFAGWRFGNGLALRGRLQEFRNGWDSGNLTETNTAGLTLTGELLAALLPGWTGNLDGYVQTVFNANTPLNQHTSSLRADASRTYSGGVTLRVSYGYLDVDHRALPGASSITRDLLMTVAHAADLAGWRGSVSYGATLRKIDGGQAEGTQVLPLASLNLALGRHSVMASLSYANINQADPALVDTRTTTTGLAYRYDLPQDKLAAELATNYRSAVPGSFTEAYRVSLNWTHLFQKQPVAQLGRAPLGAVAGAGTLDLREIAPGRPLAALEARFLALSLQPVTRPAPGLLVYDYRMLEEVTQRQRLGIQSAAGDIERAALVIEFEDVGAASTAQQTFERVRESLIRRYGQPASVFNRGEFRAALVEDVQSDQFIRLTEWRTPEGVVRFGVPRRLDRQVRMEVQIAQSFPDPTQTRWSIEELR